MCKLLSANSEAAATPPFDQEFQSTGANNPTDDNTRTTSLRSRTALQPADEEDETFASFNTKKKKKTKLIVCSLYSVQMKRNVTTKPQDFSLE